MSLDAFSARKIEGQVRLDARSTAILIVDMLNELCKPGGGMVLPGYELVNVLRGEMSLVGPRPLLPDYLPHYTAEQARRHAVKPGITGWRRCRVATPPAGTGGCASTSGMSTTGRSASISRSCC
jgi:hypothetical protein